MQGNPLLSQSFSLSSNKQTIRRNPELSNVNTKLLSCHISHLSYFYVDIWQKINKYRSTHIDDIHVFRKPAQHNHALHFGQLEPNKRHCGGGSTLSTLNPIALTTGTLAETRHAVLLHWRTPLTARMAKRHAPSNHVKSQFSHIK